jgi:hypothetical protein
VRVRQISPRNEYILDRCHRYQLGSNHVDTQRKPNMEEEITMFLRTDIVIKTSQLTLNKD